MDPLAITAATLVAKAVLEGGGKKAGESVWKALSGVGSWLKERFTADDDEAGLRALARVEDAPDSASRVETLGSVLEARLVDDGFRSGLSAEVDRVAAVGGEVGAFAVHVSGQAQVGKIVQIGTVNTETFNA